MRLCQSLSVCVCVLAPEIENAGVTKNWRALNFSTLHTLVRASLLPPFNSCYSPLPSLSSSAVMNFK